MSTGCISGGPGETGFNCVSLKIVKPSHDQGEYRGVRFYVTVEDMNTMVVLKNP